MNGEFNNNDYYNPSPAVSAPSDVTVMVLGIIAAAAANTGIPAIILGALALNKSNKYLAVYGHTNGKITAGRITGRIGLIFGIICTAIWSMWMLTYALYILRIIIA